MKTVWNKHSRLARAWKMATDVWCSAQQPAVMPSTPIQFAYIQRSYTEHTESQSFEWWPCRLPSSDQVFCFNLNPALHKISRKRDEKLGNSAVKPLVILWFCFHFPWHQVHFCFFKHRHLELPSSRFHLGVNVSFPKLLLQVQQASQKMKHHDQRIRSG